MAQTCRHLEARQMWKMQKLPSQPFTPCHSMSVNFNPFHSFPVGSRYFPLILSLAPLHSHAPVLPTMTSISPFVTEMST